MSNQFRARMWIAFCLLLVVGAAVCHSQDAELQWRPLESRGELQQHDLLLCLSSVPWCGESRSFRRDFLMLLGKRDEFTGLQLRFVDTHEHSKTLPQDAPFAPEQRPYLTLFRFGNAYRYAAKQLVPEHVVASLEHAVSTSPWDIPYQRLNSAKQLQEFVESTDRAFVLVDCCGWTPKNRNGLVEDYQGIDSYPGEVFARLGLQFNSSDERGCSATEERQVFSTFYENLTQIARARFLTPHSARFGIASLEVLEDANLDVPSGKPWVLASRTQDVTRSWKFLYDEHQLEDFLKNSMVLVDEVDVASTFLSNSPSVLLFTDRGSYLPENRDESLKALETVREVARHVLHSGSGAAARGSGADIAKSFVLPNTGSLLAANMNKAFSVSFFQDDVTAASKLLPESPKTSEGATLDATSNGSQENVSPSDDDMTKDEQSDEEPEFSSTAIQEGLIFFCFFDGAKALEESLTGRNSSTPSVVVVVPERQEYFMYPNDMPLHVDTLLDFLNQTVSGSVRSTARSGRDHPPREPVRPPFVNLDFQEVNGVPRVSLDTFVSEVVRNGKMEFRDSVVLFTLPWCGFCKKMQLVVREVHRYFKDYFQQDGTSCAGLAGASYLPPSLLQMDCSDNDCSQLVSKDDGYPSLVLFPAESNAPMVYRGPPTVAGVFQFIAARGKFTVAAGSHPSNTSLFSSSQPLPGGMEPSTVQIAESAASTKQQQQQQQQLESNNSSKDAGTVRIAVGQVLVATERLTGSSHFNGSQILLVSTGVDHVMGLTFNKQIQWDELPEIKDELKNAVKGAFLSNGGPLHDHPKQLYSITRRPEMQGFVKVCEEGLFVGGPVSTETVLQLIGENKMSASEFHFVFGYSAWTWLQLQQEIASGYWSVMQCTLVDNEMQ